eukprot:TRINITY_DN14208_c0_g1_i1.p1 TRINITY_DN14208_c0_g1~~TRINITY_DN14208_c0_g1_i1.p1  ORF type:complete len:229 (-),score=109.83 TRINITY_DN14208_c0_g1_i1:103-708(-)
MSKGSGSTSCKDAIAKWAKANGVADPSTAKEVKLYAQYPSISKMDNKLNDLTACEHLSLSTNQIEKIQPLPGMKNLKILSLGRNNIKRIEKLDDVAGTLEQLWLSYNRIEKLDGLDKLKALKVLYLSNNRIKNFDELLKLRECDSLEELLLLGNPCYENLTPQECAVEVVRRLPNLKKLDGDMITAAIREMVSDSPEEEKA